MAYTFQGLERQLNHAKQRCEDFEDTMLQLEREKGLNDRQTETLRLQLDSESANRVNLEKLVSSQASELSKANSRAAKLDRSLNKAQADLKKLEQEIVQLEAR